MPVGRGESRRSAWCGVSWERGEVGSGIWRERWEEWEWREMVAMREVEMEAKRVEMAEARGEAARIRGWRVEGGVSGRGRRGFVRVDGLMVVEGREWGTHHLGGLSESFLGSVATAPIRSRSGLAPI